MAPKSSEKKELPQKPDRVKQSALEATKKREKRDVMLVHGVNEGGDTYHVLRARDDQVEAGVVRPVQEGQALQGEVVKLTPRPESPQLFDVDVQVPGGSFNAPGSQPAPRRAARSKGPAQVATDPYRANWDRIWSKRARKKSLPN